MAGRVAPPTAWPRRRIIALMLAVIFTFASLTGAYLAEAAFDLKTGPDEYNVGAWETRNFLTKWLYEAGSVFHDGRSDAQQDEDIVRFFTLVREVNSLEQQQSDRAQHSDPPDTEQDATLDAKRHERDKLENRVEATIEHRVSAVLTDQGVTRDLLICQCVWPPVDFEFTYPPRNLAESPRDVIKLTDTTLLREDLDTQAVEAIEARTEARNGDSALAFSLSGLGAYPTIIAYEADYADALATIAHEWTHNYLYFRPLGFNYYKSYDLRAINETVAELVGQEIARLVLQRWPAPPALQPPAPAQPSVEPNPTARPRIDIAAELRKLRGEVDALLAQGKVDEAEALMEQRRQELAAQGFRIRKINQAYFAFTNLYAGEAGNPAATNPIGPKIDDLRRRSASLKDFIDRVGSVTSVASLDNALPNAQ